MHVKGSLVLTLCLIGSHPVMALDLGVFGTIYPIEELPANELIQRRLKALSPATKQRLQQLWLAKTRASIQRPKGRTLPRAQHSHSRLLDPAITFKEAIIDHQQHQIIPEGIIINPLDYTQLTKPLVFFDGDDPQQAAWVKKHYLTAILILIKGEPLKLQEEWQTKVFFDQQGKLSERFGLTKVPSVISQEGKLLKVSEWIV